MKIRVILVALVGTVLLAAWIPFAHSLNGPDRPEWVPAANWVPISNSLGLVLFETPSAQPGNIVAVPRDALLLAGPPRTGYFVVKRDGRWQRLVVDEPLQRSW